MIRLDRVSKIYPTGDAPAVTELTLDVAEGEIVVLVGPSGCGKTTTLKMINRLIEPTSGTIEVAGRDVTSLSPPELRRSIGYVIQQVGLFPHRTIAQNIATVPGLLGWDRERIDRRVDELLDVVDLDRSMGDRYPSELSGGQRQRVGVARALAADPQVMLMDEPFGAVDPIARGRLQDQFLDLQERLGKTIVFVTHDIDEAIKLGDRIAILNVGGVLEQYDTPAEVLGRPANRFVVDFLGSGRGLKQLGLLPIRTLPLEPGPVLPETATVDEARRVMAEHDVDWIAIGGDGRLHGWVPATELDGRHDLGGLPLRRFESWLTVDESLMDALDVVVSSRTSVAAVFDGDRYLGMLTAQAIGKAMLE